MAFITLPISPTAQSQHEALCRELETAGAEVIDAPPAPDVSLDAVYAHDASLATDFGLIVMRPGKANRVPKAGTTAHSAHASVFRRWPRSSRPAPPKPETSSGSECPENRCSIGHGYRTNAAGIEQMRDLLAPKGVDVLSAPLPYGPGPSACLHLMSLISLLDEQTALVDLPWLAVETVELLKSRGYKFIPIDDSERDTLACNVLALGGNRLLAIEREPQDQRPPSPRRIRRPHLPRQRTLHQRQRRPHLPNPPAAAGLSPCGDGRLREPALSEVEGSSEAQRALRARLPGFIAQTLALSLNGKHRPRDVSGSNGTE